MTYVIGIFEILEVGLSHKWVSGHGDGPSGSHGCVSYEK